MIDIYKYHQEKVDDLKKIQEIKRAVGKINMEDGTISSILESLNGKKLHRNIERRIVKKFILVAKPIIDEAVKEAKYNVECSSNQLKRTG